jgi:hypothetical protein
MKVLMTDIPADDFGMLPAAPFSIRLVGALTRASASVRSLALHPFAAWPGQHLANCLMPQNPAVIIPDAM